MRIEELLSRLEGVRGKAPQWMAKCPAHEDKSPSLSVGLKTNDRIVIHCHAACGIDAVVAALGIELHDLMGESGIEHHPLYVGQKGNQRWIDPSAALKSLEHEIYVLAIVAEDSRCGIAATPAQNMARRTASAKITDLSRYVRGLG